MRKCSRRKFGFYLFHSNFLSISMHISGSTEPITLIWVSLERSFSPTEHEYSLLQNGQKRERGSVARSPIFYIIAFRIINDARVLPFWRGLQVFFSRYDRLFVLFCLFVIIVAFVFFCGSTIFYYFDLCLVAVMKRQQHFLISYNFSQWIPANLLLGVSLRWTSISSRGSRNTPSRLKPRKPA